MLTVTPTIVRWSPTERRHTLKPMKLRRRLSAALAPLLAALVLSSTPACGPAQEAPGAPVAAAAPAYAARAEKKIAASLDETLAPGAVVFVRSKEKGDWSAAFGARTYRGTEKLTVDDHFRIGSNTKTMTGTVVLQLVEEGKLRLDDPVSKHRPDVKDARITIAHLLSMRSGLYNYSESLEVNRSLDETPARVWQPEELIAIGLGKPALFDPGTAYAYSNTNTVLLGRIVEQITGQPLERELDARIFGKLGLTHTALPSLTDATLPSPHPRGYQFGTNVGTIASEVLSPEIQAQARAGTLLPKDMTGANPSWGWAAGAGISTAPELGRYARALVTGELLGPALHEARLASVLPNDPSNPESASYGLGIGKLGPMYGHTGELPGFNTFMGHDRDKDITLVVWTPLAASPDGKAPAIEIAKIVIGELYAGDATGVSAPSKPGAGD